MKASSLVLYTTIKGVSVFNLSIYCLGLLVLLIERLIGSVPYWIRIWGVVGGDWFDCFSGVINRLVYSFFSFNKDNTLLGLNGINPVADQADWMFNLLLVLRRALNIYYIYLRFEISFSS